MKQTIPIKPKKSLTNNLPERNHHSQWFLQNDFGKINGSELSQCPPKLEACERIHNSFLENIEKKNYTPVSVMFINTSAIKHSHI